MSQRSNVVVLTILNIGIYLGEGNIEVGKIVLPDYIVKCSLLFFLLYVLFL